MAKVNDVDPIFVQIANKARASRLKISEVIMEMLKQRQNNQHPTLPRHDGGWTVAKLMKHYRCRKSTIYKHVIRKSGQNALTKRCAINA
jgi:ribosomal protein L21